MWSVYLGPNNESIHDMTAEQLVEKTLLRNRRYARAGVAVALICVVGFLALGIVGATARYWHLKGLSVDEWHHFGIAMLVSFVVVLIACITMTSSEQSSKLLCIVSTLVALAAVSIGMLLILQHHTAQISINHDFHKIASGLLGGGFGLLILSTLILSCYHHRKKILRPSLISVGVSLVIGILGVVLMSARALHLNALDVTIRNLEYAGTALVILGALIGIAIAIIVHCKELQWKTVALNETMSGIIPETIDEEVDQDVLSCVATLANKESKVLGDATDAQDEGICDDALNSEQQSDVDIDAVDTEVCESMSDHTSHVQFMRQHFEGLLPNQHHKSEYPDTGVNLANCSDILRNAQIARGCSYPAME